MTDTFNLCGRMDDAEGKCLSCGAPLPTGREEQRKFTGGKMGIVVLSDNSEEAKKLCANVNEAISQLGEIIAFDEVVDEEVIATYHVRKLPALVINGSIVSQGLISSVQEIIGEIEYMY